MSWLGAQTDYGYFLCGMALLVLALFCFRAQTLPARRSPEIPHAFLGCFALFHALSEWSELVLATLRGAGPLACAVPGALLLLSLLCLLEFGRRLSSPPAPLRVWSLRLYLPLTLCAALGFACGVPYQLGVGLLFALPAACVILRGMLRLSARHEPRDRRLALGLGAVIALQPLVPGLWPLLSALLAPDLAHPPAWRAGAEVAVQLLHGGLALLAALLFLGYMGNSGATRRRMRCGAVLLLAIVSILAGGWVLTCFLGAVADRQIRHETYTATSTIVALLQDNLSDVDQAALALSSSEAAAAVLASGRPADLKRATLELERYSRTLSIASCFLLDRNGTLVAHSNAQRRGALGRSFAYRPYFQAALAGRQSSYFALSGLSGERSYFSGAPVLGPGGAVLGVAVGVRGVEAVEAEFRKYPEVSLVSPEGIVFVSSQKRLLFRSLWPVPDPVRARLVASGQFGSLSFAPLLEQEPASLSQVRLEGRTLYAKRMPIEAQGWSVLFFQPTSLVSDYRTFGIAATCTVALLALCCFVVLIAHHEYKKSAEQLRSAKEEWERTFDAVPDLIAVMDRDQRIRRVNRSMADRLGLQPGEAEGRLCHELLECGRDSAPHPCPHLEMLRRGGAVSLPVVNEKLKGHFVVSSCPIPSGQGGVEASVHIMHDVTEQKRLEQSLKVSAERLALATEGANGALWEWDMVHDRGHVDERYFQLVGCRPSEEELTYQFFLTTIHPEDRAQVIERVREHIEGKRPMYLAQYRLVSRSGQVREVMGRGRIVRRAEDGTPLTMAGVIIDVSEQKRLADEVTRIRNLESVGILAGGMAHDFNNVLNVVCGNVAFARMLAGDSSCSAALADAEQACERALELGRRLQMLARGGLPIREPVLLSEIVASSAEAVFKDRAVCWQLSAPDDLYPVDADPRQIRQVFESLLSNAREALPGGGAVAVEIGNVELGAESALPVKAGRFVRAAIRDQGRGIAPEHLQRIFDPYFSTKDCYHEKGMGLGLPICHAVIKRHQGHISIDSELGRGTTVAVYLPASA